MDSDTRRVTDTTTTREVRTAFPTATPTPEGPPSPEFLERMATVGARYGLDMKV